MKKRRQSKVIEYTPNHLKALSKGQSEYIEAIHDSIITFCEAPAGTGKTYIAAGIAAEMLEKGQISKIILTRPLIECGEKLGHLPGPIDDKVSPFAVPLQDALSDFISGKELQEFMDEDIIEFCPLAYMRGRSLKNSFIIVDEAQNASYLQLKCILTRIGENSKMVLNGDCSQSDVIGKDKDNAFANVIRKLDGVDGISFVKLTEKDIQRHPLIAEIIKRL